VDGGPADILVSADEAKKAFVALPIGGVIEARTVARPAVVVQGATVSIANS
jgi:hypothetical protein